MRTPAKRKRKGKEKNASWENKGKIGNEKWEGEKNLQRKEEEAKKRGKGKRANILSYSHTDLDCFYVCISPGSSH